MDSLSTGRIGCPLLLGPDQPGPRDLLLRFMKPSSNLAVLYSLMQNPRRQGNLYRP
ncbi:hypothetical protein M404DRAFT_995059 [Pisolithus tinctorius Marx 270]|uniref:Uncharacterized protein n=1 Tax=Pisolithus tinctorius Marx 270 TaxID=870435 RepID=A0A0C3PQX6_PISTI|nr:hypothetical protein M404DRAFT_995059 [Pisolithus tinctorius Marx 270]